MIPKSASESAIARILNHLAIISDELDLVPSESDRLLVCDALIDVVERIARGLGHDTGRELFASQVQRLRVERTIYTKRARKAAA